MNGLFINWRSILKAIKICFILIAVLLVSTACGGTGSGSTSSSTSIQVSEVASIEVAPNNTNSHIGVLRKYTAIAILKDHSKKD
ncbi:MAG: hypothetical protein ACK5WP_05450, partial [Neisseriaceae bacterium]